MNPVLRRILDTGHVATASGHQVPVHSEVCVADGELIQTIISGLDVRCSVEVGLAYGISALWICGALHGREEWTHIAIDPNQHLEAPNSYGPAWNSVGLHSIALAGYEKHLEFYDQPSYLVLPRLCEAGRTVEFAFIDGWHTLDYVLTDFFFVDKLLRVGGVVVFHDTDYPSVQTSCKYILANLPYAMAGCVDCSGKVRNVPLGANEWGTSVALRKLAIDDRDAEFHVPF